MILKRIHLTCSNLVLQRNYHYDGWWNPPAKNVFPQNKNTTVLILGWAGSQQKHVETYTKLYANEFGIGAHGYSLPMEIAFSYNQKVQQKLAQECIEVIRKENPDAKIIIHSFSNNGGIFYQHVSRLLKENPYKLVSCLLFIHFSIC